MFTNQVLTLKPAERKSQAMLQPRWVRDAASQAAKKRTLSLLWARENGVCARAFKCQPILLYDVTDAPTPPTLFVCFSKFQWTN